MTDSRKTILVAGADEATRAFLAAQLTADGYHVLLARQAAEVRARAARGPVALIMLGDFERMGESMALLRDIRSGDGRHGQLDPAVPVVVLSRDGGELAMRRSLEAGADDHVAKPFSYPVLRARMAVVLRRIERPHSAVVRRVGEPTVDRSTREVTPRDQRVELSQKEFALLAALVDAATERPASATFRSTTPTSTLGASADRDLQPGQGAIGGPPPRQADGSRSTALSRPGPPRLAAYMARSARVRASATLSAECSCVRPMLAVTVAPAAPAPRSPVGEHPGGRGGLIGRRPRGRSRTRPRPGVQ